MNFKMGVLTACILSASYPLYAQKTKKKNLLYQHQGLLNKLQMHQQVSP